MRLVRHGGQQHPGRPPALRRRNAGNGLAQHAGHALGVQVLLEHLKAALCPGFAHRHVEWRHPLRDKGDQAQPQHVLRQRTAQLVRVVAGNQRQVALHRRGTGNARNLPRAVHALCPRLCGRRCRRRRQNRCCTAAGSRQRHDFGQCPQRLQGQRHHAPWPVAGVQQAADGVQALDLLRRVNPVAGGIALRLRKAIAPLPHPQRVLGQAGVALDSGNRQQVGRRGAFRKAHGQAVRVAGSKKK